jgi:hypothetical protein
MAAEASSRVVLASGTPFPVALLCAQQKRQLRERRSRCFGMPEHEAGALVSEQLRPRIKLSAFTIRRSLVQLVARANEKRASATRSA